MALKRAALVLVGEPTLAIGNVLAFKGLDNLAAGSASTLPPVAVMIN